jgi:uncharacterized membrane protein
VESRDESAVVDIASRGGTDSDPSQGGGATLASEGQGAPTTREEAQARADRILAFREELRELEAGGIAALPGELAARIRGHHDELLAALSGQFDVDRTDAEKQLSVGMRIASLLGAIALSFAVFFFFYRFWGAMPTAAQVGLLLAAPVVAVLGTGLAARKERTLYVAAIAALIATAAFGLTLVTFGDLFNITPSPDAFLAWGIFAGLLAYAYGLTPVLFLAIVAVTAFLSGRLGSWNGSYWGYFLQQPENLLLPGVLLLGIPAAARHRALPSFPPLYRATGLLAIFVPVLVLANAGQVSRLDLAPKTVEVLYQLTGFVLGAAAAWLGVRHRWRETSVLGTLFLVVLLYVKFFDWWWDWMPKWLFFLVLGGVAVGILLLLRRLQAAMKGAAR